MAQTMPFLNFQQLTKKLSEELECGNQIIILIRKAYYFNNKKSLRNERKKNSCYS